MTIHDDSPGRERSISFSRNYSQYIYSIPRHLSPGPQSTALLNDIVINKYRASLSVHLTCPNTMALLNATWRRTQSPSQQISFDTCGNLEMLGTSTSILNTYGEFK